MTGNCIHTTYTNGDLGDGLWNCFAHIIWFDMDNSVLYIWHIINSSGPIVM